MARLALLKKACMILVVCTAAAIAAPAQNFTLLHNFNRTDGADPNALIQATDGNFYGTTRGDFYVPGTIFKITSEGTLTTLYSFCAEFGCADGNTPNGGLTQATDGNFYGVTDNRGAYNSGTIFQITPEGILTTLYSFCAQTGCADGSAPNALIQASDGNFYGTTQWGGDSTDCRGFGCGIVFKITPEGALTTLHRFESAEGARPMARLIQATDGNFYGTTTQSGLYNSGTIFQITPGGTLTTLYAFCALTNCTDGGGSAAALIQATDGNFYGTTQWGGDNIPPYGGMSRYGTIFKLTPMGALSTLHSFDSADGAGPQAGLIQATDGNFYGTTSQGGVFNSGTIFQITPGGTLTKLYDFRDQFCLKTGCPGPETGVIQATDGSLYGTTSEDGAGNLGTVFRLALAPVASPSPTSWNFGNQALNQTSAPETVSLRNSGTALLKIRGVAIAGSGFAISANTCGTTLAIGKTCTLGVTFTPTVLGSLTGTLTFTDNAANSPQVVPLSGTGVQPATLSPPASFYGSWIVNTTSTAKTFTLTNNQTIALSIAISTTGDFAVSATTCTTSLSAKSKCTISVSFTPTALGKRTGTLSVSDSASNSPQTSALTGAGVLPATLTPATANYTVQAMDTTSLPKMFTLTNNQSVALTSIAISTTGDFAVSATTCTTSLSAKSKCTISVSFTPTALGKRTGTLSVTDSASNSPQTSALTGTGALPATLTPPGAAFGTWAVSTTSTAKTFTLTNNQSVPLSSIAISTTGDFEVSATTCTTSLAAKSTCTISVTFTPTAIGTRKGKLTVSDSASNSPHTSNLAGTGD